MGVSEGVRGWSDPGGLDRSALRESGPYSWGINRTVLIIWVNQGGRVSYLNELV